MVRSLRRGPMLGGTGQFTGANPASQTYLPGKSPMPESLTRELFARYLHTKFRLSPAPATFVETELVEVSSDDQSMIEGFDRFSLVFQGPPENYLQQRIYQMEHDEMGTFELFLVPIRQDRHGFYYQAIFNRLTPPAG